MSDMKRLPAAGAVLMLVSMVTAGPVQASPPPAYSHVVIVVEENHTPSSVLGNSAGHTPSGKPVMGLPNRSKKLGHPLRRPSQSVSTAFASN